MQKWKEIVRCNPDKETIYLDFTSSTFICKYNIHQSRLPVSHCLKVECWAEWGFCHDHNFTLKYHIHNSSALCFDMQPFWKFYQLTLQGNKTCRRTGKLACNCAFPLWSILESYIHSYQTWFKSIKGFAETDTVKIKHKNIKVRDLDLKAMYWDGDDTFWQGFIIMP